MTSTGTLKRWFDRGVEEGASHMIVAWDSFDGPEGDYPIYVEKGVDPKTRRPRNGDRVMECYRLSLGWESQSSARVQNWEMD